jgi:hypothetical protein
LIGQSNTEQVKGDSTVLATISNWQLKRPETGYQNIATQSRQKSQNPNIATQSRQKSVSIFNICEDWLVVHSRSWGKRVFDSGRTPNSLISTRRPPGPRQFADEKLDFSMQ